METIIVELYIGENGATADFMLPAHVPVSQLTGELRGLIEQVYPEISFGQETPVLCDMQTCRIISQNLTLAQAGIRDSHRLMIV